MMKFFLLPFWVLLMLTCAETNASEIGAFVLCGTLTNKRKISVVIEIEIYDDNFIYGESSWWGAELTPPETLTKNIQIKLNNKRIWVSFSAYSDLMNLNSAKLNVQEEGFQIHLDGGQSSTHYIANLYFDNEGFLVRRKVFSPAFPDEVWEETEYSFIRRNDM